MFSIIFILHTTEQMFIPQQPFLNPQEAFDLGKMLKKEPDLGVDILKFNFFIVLRSLKIIVKITFLLFAK